MPRKVHKHTHTHTPAGIGEHGEALPESRGVALAERVDVDGFVAPSTQPF